MGNNVQFYARQQEKKDFRASLNWSIEVGVKCKMLAQTLTIIMHIKNFKNMF